MSDISLSAQQQLTQAFAQLTRAQNSSPLAKQAAQVIIQHLAGNQISLNLPRQQQSIELPKPSKLPAGLLGTPVEVQLQPPSNQLGNKQAAPELAIFDPKSANISSTLLGKLSQAQIGTILGAIANKVEPQTSSKPQIVSAKVVAIKANTISVATQINGQQQTVQLSLTASSNELKVGQPVKLHIVPKGNQWQITMIVQPSAPKSSEKLNLAVDSKPSQPASKAISSNPDAPSFSATKEARPAQNPASSATPLPTSKDSTAPLQIAVSANKTAITILLQSQSARIPQTSSGNTILIPKNDIQALVVKYPALLSADLNQKIKALEPSVKNVTLELNQPATGQITAPQKVPASAIKLSPEQLQLVKQLLNNASVVIPPDNKPAQPIKQDLNLATGPKTDVSTGSTEVKGKQADISADNEPARIKFSTADTTQVQPTRFTAAEIASLTHLQKQPISQQISDIIRRIMPQTVSPSQAILQLEKALADPAIVKEPTTKAVIEQLVKTIQQSLPQGKDTDAGQIKQALIPPPLIMTNTQVSQASQPQGLIGGLITLLQVTLAARMTKTQPQHTERLAQAISSIVGGASKPTAAQSTRTMNDISQMDQKHQLLKQVGQILSQHQFSKLSSAEQNIQGQDSFYYILPSGSGDAKKDIELLIKREPESSNKQNKNDSKIATWHLTMKLDIGDVGQILTKAKLNDMTLELDLYTSNKEVKDRVLNYLPLFKKRLESLGIEVTKTQCQLGKIPSQLQQRPYQIFETQA